MDSTRKHPLRARTKTLLVTVLVLLVLFGVHYALRRSGLLDQIDSSQDLREWIAGFGAWSGIIFFLVQMITVIIAPIPSNVTTLAGSLALGFIPGFLISTAAVITGSLLMFLLARRFGAKFVTRFVEGRTLSKYMPVIEQKRDVFLFMAMLLPFFPDDALCIIAGLTGMSTFRFCVIMLITRPWGLLFASLLGGGVLSLPIWGWALVVIAVVVLFALSLKYGPALEEKLISRYHQRKKHHTP